MYIHHMKEKYITPDQAAALLNVTRATIYNYIRDGLLTKYRIKKKPILYKEEVESLLVPRAVPLPSLED